jgi:lysophospholipase L1-like esterase
MREVIAAGEWEKPAVIRGRREVAVSRSARSRLLIPVSRGDSYRIRIFYLLEGEAPATLRISGRPAGSLEPGPGWQRAVFSAPGVRAGEKQEISFELKMGSRLLLRRIDYRNYVFRLGSALLVKPGGGSRRRIDEAALAIILALLIAAAAAGALVRWREANLAVTLAGKLRPAGWLGLAAVAFQWGSGMALHVHPVLAGAVFFGAVGATAFPAGAAGWRYLASRLAVAAVGLLAALAMAEGALILWDPPISRPRVKSYMRYSPEFAWLNRPGAEGWHVDIRYHIRINRHGHRGPDHEIEKPGGTFRILGLGDSFGFGWGVEDGETYLRVLEKKLRVAGHPAEVINAGVPAWHSAQSLRYLLGPGARFKPDLVIAEFFVDDVNDLTIKSYLKGPLATRLKEEEATVRREKKSWKPRLYHVWFNYRKIRKASKDHLRRNPYPDFAAERKVLPRDFEKDPARIAGLEKIVSRWAAAGKKLGVPIVMFFMPAGGQLRQPAYLGNFRQLRRISRAAGFPFLDIVTMFENHPDPRKLYLLPRDGHMSPSGHALVGEALAKLILKEGLFKKGLSKKKRP